MMDHGCVHLIVSTSVLTVWIVFQINNLKNLWFLFTGEKQTAQLGGVEVVLQAGVGQVQNPLKQETHSGYGNCTWSA
jgi:hypothetical protein